MNIFNDDKMNYTEIDSNTMSGFLTKTFAWMLIGLGITAGIIFSISQSIPLSFFFLSNPWPSLIAFLGMIGITFLIRTNVSLNSVRTMFLTFSALNGIALSRLVIYSNKTLVFVLIMTMLLFATMATYGYFTKDDLTKLGSMLIIGLTVLFLSSLLNMFFRLEAFTLLISFVGCILFMLFIAYDVDRLKRMAGNISNVYGLEELDKFAVFGAMSLYLNFINLFLHLLTIVDSKKKEK